MKAQEKKTNPLALNQVKNAVPSTNNAKRPLSARKTKSKVTLERVIGTTTTSDAGLSVNQFTSDIAYIAGCMVVIYSPSKNRQIMFLSNDAPSPKTISSIAYSPNGKMIAAGESGHQPSVVVWDTQTGNKLAQLKDHKYGVVALAWSPNQKYLVSVGHEHDGYIRLWDWKAGKLLATNKLQRKVNSIAFNEEGNLFVTVGDRFAKVWDIDETFRAKNTSGKGKSDYLTLDGKKCILGALGEASFTSVVCGLGKAKGNFYTMTSDGNLCLFSLTARALDKWLHLKCNAGHSICISETLVCCGSNSGLARLFDPMNLQFKCTLPKPPSTSSTWVFTNVSMSYCPQDIPADAVIPDVKAMKLLADNQKVAIVYSDHSLFIWDISNLKKIGKYRSFLAHSGCIWDIDVLPSNTGSSLPENTFVTCSTDNTIKFWNIDNNDIKARQSRESISILARDLLHILHIKQEDVGAELQGVRCIKFSPDGNLLAMGDRVGNLRVYNLSTFQLIYNETAHDSEILSLDFSTPFPDSKVLLATGSRDRLIHLFAIQASVCDFVETLSDHSAAVTSLKFSNSSGATKLLSCGADKSIIFRSVTYALGEFKINRQFQNVVQYGTIFDMDVDATQKYIVTSGGDKRLSIWNIEKGKSIRSYKVEGSDAIKVKLDPSGIHCSTSSADKFLRMYDFYNGQCIAKFRGHAEVATGMKFTGDCKKLISVSGDGCIFIWKISPDLVKAMQERLAELTSAKPKPSLLTPLSTPRTTNSSVALTASSYMDSPLFKEVDKVPSPPNSARGSNRDEIVRQSENLKNMLSAQQAWGDQKPAESPEISEEPTIPLSETSLPAWARPPAAPTPNNNANEVKVENRWAQRIQQGYKLYSQDIESELISITGTHRRLTIEGEEEKSADSKPIDIPLPEPSVDPKIKTMHMDDSEEVMYDHGDLDNSGVEDAHDSESEEVIYFSPENISEPQEGDFIVKTKGTLTSEVSKNPLPTAELSGKIEAGELEVADDEEEDPTPEQDKSFEYVEGEDFIARNYSNLENPAPVPAANLLRTSISSKYFKKSQEKSAEKPSLGFGVLVPVTGPFTDPPNIPGKEQVAPKPQKKEAVTPPAVSPHNVEKPAEKQAEPAKSPSPTNDNRRVSVNTFFNHFREDAFHETTPLNPPPPPPEDGNEVLDKLLLLKTQKTEVQEEPVAVPPSSFKQLMPLNVSIDIEQILAQYGTPHEDSYVNIGDVTTYEEPQPAATTAQTTPAPYSETAPTIPSPMSVAEPPKSDAVPVVSSAVAATSTAGTRPGTSLRLSKSVKEYQTAMQKLDSMFTEAVSLFDEVQQEVGAFDENPEEKELVKSFQNMFEAMQVRLSGILEKGKQKDTTTPKQHETSQIHSVSTHFTQGTVIPGTATSSTFLPLPQPSHMQPFTTANSMASVISVNIDAHLERYSELLVSLVTKKLGDKKL